MIAIVISVVGALLAIPFAIAILFAMVQIAGPPQVDESVKEFVGLSEGRQK